MGKMSPSRKCYIRFPIFVFLSCHLIISAYICFSANSYFVEASSSPDQEKMRIQFQTWQQFLQECEAELPDDCPLFIKALGQNCTLDNECLTPAKCLDFKCRCPDNFLPSGGKCLQAGLNQTCVDGLCAPPLICTRRDICDCPPQMDQTRTGCQPRCNEGELPFNGTCVKLEKIGGRCNNSVQCQAAFSFCRSEKCDCIPGTRERGGECQPTYNCPDGQKPLEDPQSRDNPLKCHSQTCSSHQFPTKPTKIKVDTCPNGSYCVFPSYQDLLGFCCPEKSYCPVGEPLTNKVCVNPRNEQERCPPATHHCYVGLRGPTCCPLACPSIQGQVAVVEKGVCYPRKHLGDGCNVTAQCPPPSKCNVTCLCPEGYMKQFSSHGEKCVKLCQPGEVLVRAECLPLSVPSRNCTHSSQCTAGSKCFNNRCDCPCGTMLYNGYCINKPQCPNFGYGIHDPLTIGNGTAIECSPTAVPTANATCPDKSFCFPALVYSGGICCPFPEPVCNWGRQPPTDRRGDAQSCELPILTGGRERCPRDQYCHDYMLTLLPTLNRFMDRKGVCCWESHHTNNFPNSRERTTARGNFGGGVSLFHNDLCPPQHRTITQFGNQPQRCNYYAYVGECGLKSGCFLHRDSPSFQSRNSGICCAWQG